MTIHRYHPDPERPGDFLDEKELEDVPFAITKHDTGLVLYDDCERCAEHAEHPFASLDNQNLAKLWRKMQRVELDGVGHYANANEGRACRHLHAVMMATRRLFELNLQATIQVTEPGEGW